MLCDFCLIFLKKPLVNGNRLYKLACLCIVSFPGTEAMFALF